METKTKYQRVFAYYPRYPRALALGGLCVVLSAIVALYMPSVVRMAIDDLTAAHAAGVGPAHSPGFYAALVVLVSFVQGIFLFLQRKILIGMSRDVEYDLRNDFFEHLERLSPNFYTTHRTGDLMARAGVVISSWPATE